jgi:hypothetical protein
MSVVNVADQNAFVALLESQRRRNLIDAFQVSGYVPI